MFAEVKDDAKPQRFECLGKLVGIPAFFRELEDVSPHLFEFSFEGASIFAPEAVVHGVGGL
jgi:hypothetical protein